MGFWNRSSRLDPNHDVFSKMNDLVSRIDSLESRVKELQGSMLEYVEARLKGYSKTLENFHERLVKLEKNDLVDNVVSRLRVICGNEIRQIIALESIRREREINGFLDNEKIESTLKELRRELRRKIIETLIQEIENKLLEQR